jgi:hypothetical protein
MDPTGDLAMWNLIVGFISATVVLPVIQQPTWTARTRSAVTFVYSVIAGLGTAYFTGAFEHFTDVRAGITSVLFTLVAAITSYQGFGKPTGIAPGIEAATSPGRRAGPKEM